MESSATAHGFAGLAGFVVFDGVHKERGVTVGRTKSQHAAGLSFWAVGIGSGQGRKVFAGPSAARHVCSARLQGGQGFVAGTFWHPNEHLGQIQHGLLQSHGPLVLTQVGIDLKLGDAHAAFDIPLTHTLQQNVVAQAGAESVNGHA